MPLLHRTRSFSLALAIALLPFAAALAAQVPSSTQAPPWKPFGSPAEGFRALFPSQPEVSKSSVPVGGDTYELRSYTAQAASTTLYVAVCDYGAKGLNADSDQMLSSAKTGAVEHMSAHLLSEEKITLNSSHGVAFEAESDKMHFSARMYMTGGVLYQIIVASPIDEKFADTARFFDSFQLLPRPSTQAAADAQGPDWKPYAYPSEGFSASFPSAPTMQKQNIPTDAGAFELRTYVVENSSAALIAAVCDYGATASGKDPDLLLADAEKGAINNLKAHLVNEKKIALGAYHGVEFEADSDTAHISARIYLAGTQLYQAIVASPLNVQYADTVRFLDSFQLLAPRGNH
jgi:hypothetical protein